MQYLEISQNQLAAFRRRLRSWYAANARPLPWRGTDDPYRIWVSEIMLQQTTTQTVKGYFERFIARFPTVHELAAADLDRVHRLWEGLGYYRRCAQMHRAARIIVEQYGGDFPTDYADARALPGVGRYTAGAILSIAFDRRLPILEANTQRLYARLLALRADPTRREANETLWAFAEKILPKKNVGRFNQALMDLGSMICTPREPKCPICPVRPFCRSAAEGLQGMIPYPKTKDAKEERTEVALQVRKNGKFLMVRYPEGRRWAGLWDFPRAVSRAEIPGEIVGDDELRRQLAAMTGRRLMPGKVIETMKHSVTRYRITLFFCEGRDVGKAAAVHDEPAPFETRWASVEEIRVLPLNSTARTLFQRRIETG